MRSCGGESGSFFTGPLRGFPHAPSSQHACGWQRRGRWRELGWAFSGTQQSIWQSRAWPAPALPMLRMPGPSRLLDICEASMPIPSPPRQGSTPADAGVISPCWDRGQRFEGLKVEGECVGWQWFLREPLPDNIPSCFSDRAFIWASSRSCTGLSAQPFVPLPQGHSPTVVIVSVRQEI